MSDSSSNKELSLVEGLDYYFENGFMVFTAVYLLKRGYCCNHGCRHCPYGFTITDEEKTAEPANPSSDSNQKCPS
jgi:hypothetical protein